jgi:hypothetical protein
MLSKNFPPVTVAKAALAARARPENETPAAIDAAGVFF